MKAKTANILSATNDNASNINDFSDSFTYIDDTFKENKDMIKLCAKSYFNFKSDFHFNLSEIPYMTMLYIQKEHIILTYDKQLFSLEKGSIAIIPQNKTIKFHAPAVDTLGYIFILSGYQINFYLNKLNINDIYIRKLTLSSNIIGLVEKIYNHVENDCELATIYYSNKLNEIFYELCRLNENDNDTVEEKHIPAYIKEIKKLFDTEYYDDYSLDFLEETFNKNKYRISREFSDAYNIPPFQYLNKVRLNKAKELLLNSELNIREIGYEVGIRNTNHFINLFKRETGTTPLSFRKDAPDFLKDI